MMMTEMHNTASRNKNPKLLELDSCGGVSLTENDIENKLLYAHNTRETSSGNADLLGAVFRAPAIGISFAVVI